MTSISAATFTPSMKPGMNAAATIQGDCWRIGILSDSLLRLEWSDSGVFEDNATQMAFNRDFDGEVPHFTTDERDGLLIIETDALRLTYDRKPFTKEGLSIVVKGVPRSQRNTWHYGDTPFGNLGGTARTLDEVDGRTDMGLGVCSTDGWAVIDDSASNVVAAAEQVNGEANPFGLWVAPRDHQETDLYFFGHGLRFKDAVRDLYRLTGPTPLLPRFAMGNWWSRYHRYTEPEYLNLMDRFEAEKLPFTTAVIDMDWHLVDAVDPKYGSGWTGYTWNTEFFPDPERFLTELRRRGLKTTLNVHPRDGVRAFEKPYVKVAAAMGVNAEAGEPVEFDLTSPKFMEAYFDMHHELEDEGVDFWWLDWQQGGVTRLPGLDPLWMLNHMHYLDSGRDGRWPLTFSRYAGPGSHRYPVGFSGDTVVTWESLKFQPEFTATASNVGYGWWSHDIGGHMFGYRDDELEARWYQLGVFSPINRLHSTDSPFNGKEPWNFDGNTREAMNKALRLRHELIPYLYTMNWRAAFDDEPIVQPMYWAEPNNDSAYDYRNEFRFGSELIVAPIVDPEDADARRAKADVWLPQGEWFDFFDGRRYLSADENGRRLSVWRELDRIPVFAKAGAIVPMQPLAGEAAAGVDGADADAPRCNDIANPRALRVVAFPGANGSCTLNEDAGRFPESHDAETAAREAGLAQTDMRLTWNADGTGCTFAIDPVRGETASVPSEREWTIVLRGVAPATCTASVDGTEIAATTSYDPATLSMSVTLPAVSTASSVVISLSSADGKATLVADNPVHDDVFAILNSAQMLFLTKGKAMDMVDRLGTGALVGLHALERDKRGDGDFWQSHMPQSVISAIEEVLLRA